jgi:hypothetical protein
LAKEKNFENNENLDLTFVDENDDITEYIQTQSFNSLLQRFGMAEEDENIRNEDFNPLVVGRAPKNTADEKNYEVHTEDMIVTEPETPIPLQNEFGSAESAFDNDAISFDDIDRNDSEKTADEPVADNKKSTESKTGTRVVYIDENIDDGIKRNTDIEVSSVFKPD